ncbi:MAG: cystathionine beta-lyase [Pseudomonadota bacterium]
MAKGKTGYGSMIDAGKAVANPPVVRASTVLFNDYSAFQSRKTATSDETYSFTYGRRGTPTLYALYDHVAAIYGADTIAAFPTGVAAIAHCLLAFLKPGDHLLLPDNVFSPTRRIAHHLHEHYAIESDYYPSDLSALAPMIKANTKAIYVECPGSVTLEVTDVPAISELAHQNGLMVFADDTYSTGILCRPLDLGVDIAILAGTKYLGGHSDLMMGLVITKSRDHGEAVQSHCNLFGQSVSPDDAYLALRGARTLSLRLERHGENATALATFLRSQPGVRTVFHPSMPDHPGSDIWQRDFTGSNGLVTVEFESGLAARLPELVGALTRFGIGSSWGGFESLVMPANIDDRCRAEHTSGPLLRFHAGLEKIDDLTADLANAFKIFA